LPIALEYAISPKEFGTAGTKYLNQVLVYAGDVNLFRKNMRTGKKHKN
jgi:hypothetical protein